MRLLQKLRQEIMRAFRLGGALEGRAVWRRVEMWMKSWHQQNHSVSRLTFPGSCTD